ncbi:MAG TPA: GNAT family N-acetyltransferase [Candidatus Dormibacteraeota bacterium]|nr:GNAT family N-acetyltransferase [Candidatus Dormibacteraeota bacterium]
MDTAGETTLPPAPETLSFGDVRLQFVRISPGDEKRGYAPFYSYRILAPDGSDAGHINFRIGDSVHIHMFAGHIGYEVLERFRGRRFAFQACKAIAPLVRQIYPDVIITCDPDNFGSKRTIERLGAMFIDEVPVPRDEPAYERGSRRKRRYRWVVTDEQK